MHVHCKAGGEGGQRERDRERQLVSRASHDIFMRHFLFSERILLIKMLLTDACHFRKKMLEVFASIG